MALRRGEHCFDAPNDIPSNGDEQPKQSKRSRLPVTTSPKITDEEPPPIHLALTNSGPQSLANFIRDRLEEVRGNANPHGDHASKPIFPARTRSLPIRFIHRNDNASSRTFPLPSAVLLVDNAPSELNELVKPNRFVGVQSGLGQALLNRTSSNPASMRRGSNSMPTSPSPLDSLESVPMNFEEHTQSVRSRIRSQSERASPSGSNTSVKDDIAGEAASRRRKTGRNLSHLVTLPSQNDVMADSLDSCLGGDTQDDPVAVSSSSSHLDTTDDEDDSRAADLPSSLNSVQYGDGESDLDMAMVDLIENALGGTTHKLIDSNTSGPSNHLKDSDFALYNVTPCSRTENPQGRSSTNHSRHVPAVAPRFVNSKRKSDRASRSKTAPTTPQGLDYMRMADTAISDSRQARTSNARKILDRWAELTNASQTKPKNQLDMIFDPSSSAWTPCHPGFQPFTQGYRSPSFKDSGQYTTLSSFNYDIWCNVSKYLSAADLKRLRLVNHELADQIAPLLVRSVVTTFGKPMFHLGDWDGESTVPDSQSVLAKYGKYIQKFGISFDYDSIGLAYTPNKVFSELVHAWFGDYEWPVSTYPRFTKLQKLEDLVDCNRPLLKEALAHLTGVSELALSIDSGHGWLEGPDFCDLALFEANRTNGSKVFGETFQEDVWDTYSRNEYFKWAQQNSINATLQRIAPKTGTWRIRRRIKELSRMLIQDYDSFREQHSQCDFNPHAHTGGQVLQAQPVQQPVPRPVQNQIPDLLPNAPPAVNAPSFPQLEPQSLADSVSTSGYCRSPPRAPIPLQWPLIFDCYNIAAGVGGRELVRKSAHPVTFPLIPRNLTELQAQWLMETLWAQRAFLSSYTTAIITHKFTFRNVHTLTIAKLSSGLLPSLMQNEFWTSLTSLKRLKILVKPDWRDEHVYGDKFHALNMPINPSLAAGKFTEFLSRIINNLENLSHLTVGYFGGGEHATGLFARNTHILPAPITEAPQSWVSNHDKEPDMSTLLIFPHIRDLTFENCWFSPCMLEAFMEKSRDTSLHTLVLDSVSMLPKHCTASTDGPLSTMRSNLQCLFDEENWFKETLPTCAVWTEVFNNIAPGDNTMEDRKLRTGVISEDESASNPEKEFRGNVTRIVLQSCGYCRISGVNKDQFNQNDVVVQPTSGTGNLHQFNGIYIHNGGGTTCDIGLQVRKARFDGVDTSSTHVTEPRAPRSSWRELGTMETTSQDNDSPETYQHPVMMSTSSPDRDEYFGLGTLTQCIHPIEKRVLEKAWGMRFGWGNDMRRWESVSDGWLEGGTGRFSGTISTKDDDEYPHPMNKIDDDDQDDGLVS